MCICRVCVCNGCLSRVRLCMRVSGTCVSTLSFLQFTFCRIRFYSIMQLACVFKYILEFGTLVETTSSRHTFVFVPSFRVSFAFADPRFPAFREARRRLSPAFIHKGTLRRICTFHRSHAIEIVHEAVLNAQCMRSARIRRGETTSISR